jgi:hypothetical protein
MDDVKVGQIRCKSDNTIYIIVEKAAANHNRYWIKHLTDTTRDWGASYPEWILAYDRIIQDV